MHSALSAFQPQPQATTQVLSNDAFSVPSLPEKVMRVLRRQRGRPAGRPRWGRGSREQEEEGCVWGGGGAGLPPECSADTVFAFKSPGGGLWAGEAVASPGALALTAPLGRQEPVRLTCPPDSQPPQYLPSSLGVP